MLERLHAGVRQCCLCSTSSRACGLARNFQALGLDDLTFWPTELCDQRKTLIFSEFCDVFLSAFGLFFLRGENDWSFCCPCCDRVFVALASFEAVMAPWFFQPNRYVDETTTQVDGGEGLPVCPCKRLHEGERVTGQLSRSTLSTVHEYNGNWPTSKEQRCAFASPRGPLFFFERGIAIWAALRACGSWTIANPGRATKLLSVGETVLLKQS